MRSNLITRTIFGAVYIGVLMLGMFVHAWVFYAVFLLAMMGTLVEFIRLFKSGTTFELFDYGVLFSAFSAYSIFFFTDFLFWSKVWWFFLSVPALVVFGSLLKGNNRKRDDLWQILAGLVYIVVPFIHMVALVNQDGQLNSIWLFYIFIFIWGNDSFAYLFGTQFGKHRIWPAVSPKKSWEGSIGGLMMILVMCYVLWRYIANDQPLWVWLGFGLVVVVSATLGDFFESHLKRLAGVKDSGNILPGHGGFFDRFDSTLFAVPATVVYLHLLQIL